MLTTEGREQNKHIQKYVNHYNQVELSTLEIIGYGIKDMSISTLET